MSKFSDFNTLHSPSLFQRNSGQFLIAYITQASFLLLDQEGEPESNLKLIDGDLVEQ
jgi:hypothetical protein